jgi:hypothetical protein
MVGAAETAVKNGALRVSLNQNDVQCVAVHKKMTQNSNSLPQKSIEHTFVCEGDIDLFSRIPVLLCVFAPRFRGGGPPFCPLSSSSSSLDDRRRYTARREILLLKDLPREKKRAFSAARF